MEEKKQNDKPLNKDFKVPKLRFKEFKKSWSISKLGNLVKIKRGGSPRPIEKYISKNNDGINWIKISDADESGYINKTEEKIILEGVKNTRLVHKGDLLLSNSMSFGRPYILNIDGAIHDGWLLISEFINEFNKEFLRAYLESNICKSQYQKAAAGGVVSNLNKEIVKSIYVSYPSIIEQNKIARFLSLTDYKLEVLEAKIATLKKYRKGIIHHLIKKGSLTSKIRDLVRIEKKTGLASSYGKDIGSYPFFINNDEGIEKYCDEYAFDGQYLIINTGGTASVKYYDGKFSAMSDCLILRPIAHAIGLYYFLVANEKQINTAGFQGTGLKHLDQKWFFNLKVILPNLSDAELNKLNELTEFQIENLKKKAQLIKSFKQYLLTNMFI